jgi:hypothetical protein
MDGWRTFWQSGKIQDYLTYKQFENTKQAEAADSRAINSIQGGGKADEYNG